MPLRDDATHFPKCPNWAKFDQHLHNGHNSDFGSILARTKAKIGPISIDIYLWVPLWVCIKRESLATCEHMGGMLDFSLRIAGPECPVYDT